MPRRLLESDMEKKSHPSVYVSAVEPEKTKQIRWRILVIKYPYFFLLDSNSRLNSTAQNLTWLTSNLHWVLCNKCLNFVITRFCFLILNYSTIELYNVLASIIPFWKDVICICLIKSRSFGKKNFKVHSKMHHYYQKVFIFLQTERASETHKKNIEN